MIHNSYDRSAHAVCSNSYHGPHAPISRLPWLLLLIALIGLSAASGANVTFFSFSDSHYKLPDTNGNPTVNVINTLPGTPYPPEIGGSVQRPRAIVMQGDLIDDGAVAARYPIQWTNFLADFGVDGEGRCIFPVFEGVGNHDLNPNLFVFEQVKARNLVRKNLGYISNISSNGYHYSWDWDGVHFVNVNLFAGNVWEGEADAYGKAHHPQFARAFLEDDLKRNVGNSGRPVVLVQHFRPIDENWWTYSAADKLHKILQDYNVILILVGHQGGGVNNTWRGFNWVSSNGTLVILGITPENKLFAVERTGGNWGRPFQKSIYFSYEESGLPAVVNNGDWVPHVAVHSATLSGKILYERAGPSEVTLYWGTKDGGKSPEAWQHSKSIGRQPVREVFNTVIEGLQPWTTYYYRCYVSNRFGGAWAETSIPFTTKGLLPAEWQTRFVGFEQRPWGGAHSSNSTLIVRGSGRDIGEGSEADNFQYAYKTLNGDGEITARVASMIVDSREPKAGIMFRESLDKHSPSVSLLLSSRDGVRLYSRATAAGSTSKTDVTKARAPYWLRLTRSGNTFTGYASEDGNTWTQVGSPVTIALPRTLHVGLAVTAGNRDGSKNHTSLFDSISLTGQTQTGRQGSLDQSSPDAFKLVVIPDTQWAARKWPNLISEMTRWIVQNREKENIRYVLHVGDMVQLGQSEHEWKNFDYAIRILEQTGTPFALAVGNHDYDRIERSRSTVLFNRFFPIERISKVAGFGGSFPDGKSDNSFHTFEAGGKKWLVLALNFDPSESEIAWANEVVSRHPDRQVILVTHSYLTHTKRDVAGEKLWDRLVRLNPNFSMVFCGHLSTVHSRATGEHGNTVCEMLFDWQNDRDPEPNSYLALITVDPAAGVISSRSYSPVLDRELTQGRTGKARFENVVFVPGNPAAAAGVATKRVEPRIEAATP